MRYVCVCERVREHEREREEGRERKCDVHDRSLLQNIDFFYRALLQKRPIILGGREGERVCYAPDISQWAMQQKT